MKTTSLLSLALLSGTFTLATPPRTLLDYRKTKPLPATLHDSVLVTIDAQREYVDGKLALSGMNEAVTEAARLLQRARAAGTPVIHIVQHSPAGSPLFDPTGPYAVIVPQLMPREGETVIVKTLPQCFCRHAARSNAQATRTEKRYYRGLHDPYVCQCQRACRAGFELQHHSGGRGVCDSRPG
jgi:Isochorismatase family